MSVLDGLKETLNVAKDAQTLPVLRERLALAQEQLAVAESKISVLETENAELLRENREFRNRLESFKKEAEYLDLGMCVLKANPDGGYFDTPLCSSCKRPFSKFGSSLLACGTCGFKIDSAIAEASIRSSLATK